MKLYKKVFAEFLGSYLLVFCGTGAIVIDSVSHGGVGSLGIALTFGGVVMAIIYSIGDVSGAHINPAVTLAFALAGKLPKHLILPYWVSQFAGGIAASLTLALLFPSADTLGQTNPAGPVMQSFVLELILTFFLMFVIIQVATGSKEQGLMAGIAIGTVVFIEAAFAGPICGASMNPARSLGPAVVSGDLSMLWIYLIAPVVGALGAIGIWKAIK